jgi:hypothetical protein
MTTGIKRFVPVMNRGERVVACGRPNVDFIDCVLDQHPGQAQQSS